MSFRILRENELQISAETRKINRPDQDLFITPLKETMRLREFYDRSLQAAIGDGCDTALFALPDFAGVGITQEETLQIAVDSFTSFLEEHEIEIILVTDNASTEKISGACSSVQILMLTMKREKSASRRAARLTTCVMLSAQARSLAV